jgi:hypothetical protein
MIISLRACSLGLCMIAANIPPVWGQATFWVVTSMNRYGQPAGLIEGSPGVFYSQAGSSTEAALSVTAQGSKVILATFPSGDNIQSLLVSGPNGRFYSIVELSDNPANVFSVGPAAGSKQVYAPQSFVPSLTQNLPDGTLLGVDSRSRQIFGIWSNPTWMVTSHQSVSFPPPTALRAPRSMRAMVITTGLLRRAPTPKAPATSSG